MCPHCNALSGSPLAVENVAGTSDVDTATASDAANLEIPAQNEGDATLTT